MRTMTPVSLARAGLCAALLAVAFPAHAATTPKTQYFVDTPGAQVPLPIGAFSSDARADVAAYSNAGATDIPAHGKFSLRTTGSPFSAGQTLQTMIVLAQTPAKLITFTFTSVTIDAADATSSTNERVTFEAQNYTVKFSAQK